MQDYYTPYTVKYALKFHQREELKLEAYCDKMLIL